MKALVLLFTLMLSLLSYASDLETLLPSNHPTKKLTLNLLFSDLQQSSRSWIRNGYYEERENCLYWIHDNDVSATTCLNKDGRNYQLLIKSQYIKEAFEFEFSRDVDFTIFDLLSFDANLMHKILISFKTQSRTILYEVSENTIHIMTSYFGRYEFFSTLSPWGNGGVRQEVFGRCSTCSGRHYQAYIDTNLQVEYRASHIAGRLMPSAWNESLEHNYYSILKFIASNINLFE